MSLKAVLTVGWRDDVAAANSVVRFADDGAGHGLAAAFESAGALAHSADVFAIRRDSLPTVLFCLQATMGLDCLSILGPQTWAS